MAGKKQHQHEQLLSILKKGNAWTKTALAQKLKCTNRTIERYLKELRETGIAIVEEGNPTQYSLEAHHWRLSDTAFSFSEVDFGILKTAIEAAHIVFGETTYNQDLQRIMRKLGEGIDESFLEIDLDQYAQHWYFHVVSASHLQIDSLKLLAEAIWKRQRIIADYFSIHTGKQDNRVTLLPHCLAWINGSWLLAATYIEGGKMRDFSLADLHNLGIAAPQNEMDHFERNADFDPQQFYGYRFGAMAGNDPNVTYEVRIYVAPQKARAFIRKQYHPTQQIEKENTDGSLIVSFECENLFDIKAFLLSWGGGIRVLEPPELVTMIQSDIEAMSALYGNDG